MENDFDVKSTRFVDPLVVYYGRRIEQAVSQLSSKVQTTQVTEQAASIRLDYNSMIEASISQYNLDQLIMCLKSFAYLDLSS